ncbi:WW domain-binding protein 11-like [Portunus trituberculatus]|uniref:WW domain-binding protein 11-like n=1 Tax=Portunus trituberculatus TaxID=210409 RepID=UPI001E1CB1FF|nr:WW domain-binding protein 11-like [Portunus trituberculatus]
MNQDYFLTQHKTTTKTFPIASQEGDDSSPSPPGTQPPPPHLTQATRGTLQLPHPVTAPPPSLPPPTTHTLTLSAATREPDTVWPRHTAHKELGSGSSGAGSPSGSSATVPEAPHVLAAPPNLRAINRSNKPGHGSVLASHSHSHLSPLGLLTSRSPGTLCAQLMNRPLQSST